MKYEPAISREELVMTVRQDYGLPVETLSFVPLGFASVCYALHCGDGAQYFLKLWPNTRDGRAAASRRQIFLPLTQALHGRGLYPRVPYPLPTRGGALWSAFANTPFAVFPFLPGPAPPSPLPPALRDELARSLACIHQSTSGLADVLPPRETFDIPFADDVRRGLAAVERIGPQDRPGLRALREFLLPRRDEVLSQLARLHRLQEVVQNLPGSLVLCHTDIGTDNLLVDEQRRFSILDWDDATLAPPEYDLWVMVGKDFARFLQIYRQAGGARPLHEAHFAFALLRRFLDDMAARLLGMLENEQSNREDEEALDGIAVWGFAQWAILDKTLVGVAATLHE